MRSRERKEKEKFSWGQKKNDWYRFQHFNGCLCMLSCHHMPSPVDRLIYGAFRAEAISRVTNMYASFFLASRGAGLDEELAFLTVSMSHSNQHHICYLIYRCQRTLSGGKKEKRFALFLLVTANDFHLLLCGARGLT
ncbi:unnamed protein product [Cercopithifilaria johnstoni]|uniref:Uncharacterized protein n=1 Tax=Cercopithifilaria johnstoni TaxID=2874296 RepID=A0A8J2LZJ6_9BILA|nr:unnamed protein product [Cercopithifilaria johnstoni]